MYVDELKELLADLGQPKFRANQLFKWLHSGVTDFDDMNENCNVYFRNRERCYNCK